MEYSNVYLVFFHVCFSPATTARMSTLDATITTTGDVAGVIYFSTDAWDVAVSFIALALVILVILLSYLVQWIVFLALHLFCGSVIRTNDQRRYKDTILLNPSPLVCTGLTTSRIEAVHLALSWFFLVLVSAGILLFFECRITLWGSFGGSVFVVILGFIGQSQWPWSFLLRFVVLFNDVVRVGDIIVLHDRVIGRVSAMWALGVQIRIIPKDRVREAHRAFTSAKREEQERQPGQIIERNADNTHKDDMASFMEHVAKSYSGVAIEKAVPYTTVMNPEFAWIVYSNRDIAGWS